MDSALRLSEAAFSLWSPHWSSYFFLVLVLSELGSAHEQLGFFSKGFASET
jgi:hypothetical protein